MTKFIGRIITDIQQKISSLEFIDQTSDVSLLYDSIPTIIVGFKKACSIFGESNISMTDRKIDDNLYWTPSDVERRQMFEDDMRSFEENVISKLSDNIRHICFNPTMSTLSKVKSFITFMRTGSDKYIYYNDENCHMYIFFGDSIVVGLSLNELEYIGISKSKVVRKVKSIDGVHFTDGSFLGYRMRNILRGSEKCIPYLFSMRFS